VKQTPRNRMSGVPADRADDLRRRAVELLAPMDVDVSTLVVDSTCVSGWTRSGHRVKVSVKLLEGREQ